MEHRPSHDNIPTVTIATPAISNIIIPPIPERIPEHNYINDNGIQIINGTIVTNKMIKTYSIYQTVKILTIFNSNF